ncbi:hypothetical protein FNH04_38675 [Streptomyces phyllanthi]|uniref:Uncharacterized protein n=1 Tax=Streptomyces phyllanthi TaxID=1803180 RepID=A0A5N8WGI9_9ACTN|nr:hypothetical protein [Streptomyces phyllanthi]
MNTPSSSTGQPARGLPRVAVVIRASEDVLGSLWVAFPDEAAATDCGPTLPVAARVAAPL